MILIIGEILFDELPSGRRPGGAPFNVARHLVRAGFDARFVSRVGEDSDGNELIDEVDAAKLPRTLIQRDEQHSTGRVEVHVDKAGIPSYSILPDAAYDYIQLQDLDAECALADVIYFGSLIQRTESGRQRLQEFLVQQPYGIQNLYDMNLRDGCREKEIVLPSLEQCNALKINDEELVETGRMIGSSLSGDALIEQLMESFNIRQVALTQGAKGSVFFAEGERFEQPASLVSQEQIMDTVGAGDAFTAVLAMGLSRGWKAEMTLALAGALSERICTIAGAVPPDDGFYKELKGQF
ncbi:MAG: hypothetical protein JXR23_08675 [Pontiellaceae bacterium]|nr:hypothetical protein [Pontiellaceae bacterium]